MLIAIGGTSCVAIQPICNTPRIRRHRERWEALRVASLVWTRWLRATPRGDLNARLTGDASEAHR